ncbi:hypothetical protein KIW84_056795 [Lathyrus oleraceus]|uniref:Uncharacterized protein n=1 Tax=Pisum sativum TaxID=3888 RepID=A0A9D5ALM3_PEA|nr:hypothetical protein KIW84_056795 [Pisum sativum]
MVREEMCEFTSTESLSSQASKGLPTEGKIEQSKELITRLSNKEDITESNKKISNDDGCYALRRSLFFWINKKQACASWCTAEAEFRESFSKLMLEEYDVITLYSKNLNSIRYLIQHGWNKNLDSYSQLIKNIVKGKVVTLEHMDNMEQLTAGRNAIDSLSVLHVLMHKQSAIVKPVERWNKRSLQKTGFKKTCSEVVTRNLCVNTPKTCDKCKECRRLFDWGERWKTT